ncbi:hypothetical protein LOC68_02500 [Blastopirellula sp. JC732]|uniref:Uncharacterized protein n=1 Tax=Blastopirellula sediminis TaxID=2894196 RepID=A0A9X1MJV6_9BACT|nr:hypothetical protein [Blastopirellula sediminis]MCC9607945.1 hypothetical protein [Blastopirellula sediminis]MCC9627262.1 hypothetical protein [Blastopirellula sediminis]
MTKQVRYVQCGLRRQLNDGTLRATSYIPEQFAKQGGVLRLRDEQDQWTDGWIVEEVGLAILDSDDVPDSHKAIRAHRKQTGDSSRREKN